MSSTSSTVSLFAIADPHGSGALAQPAAVGAWGGAGRGGPALRADRRSRAARAHAWCGRTGHGTGPGRRPRSAPSAKVSVGAARRGAAGVGAGAGGRAGGALVGGGAGTGGGTVKGGGGTTFAAVAKTGS